MWPGLLIIILLGALSLIWKMLLVSLILFCGHCLVWFLDLIVYRLLNWPPYSVYLSMSILILLVLIVVIIVCLLSLAEIVLRILKLRFCILIIFLESFFILLIILWVFLIVKRFRNLVPFILQAAFFLIFKNILDLNFRLNVILWWTLEEWVRGISSWKDILIFSLRIFLIR